MKVITLFMVLLCLVSCNVEVGLNNNLWGGNSEISLWKADSERIVIVQDNGNATVRYQTYDYSRDTINESARKFMANLMVTEDGLSCINDGVTYFVTVTDGSGIDSNYHSSNAACGDSKNSSYIDTEKIASLIILLSA